MNLEIEYGRTGLSFELPSDLEVTVLEPHFTPGAQNQQGAVEQAVSNPIGCQPLDEIVKASDRVGVVFSDITRPTPYDVMLPPLLEKLKEAGIPNEQVLFFNATGTHRTNTEEELRSILGTDVVRNYQIIQNECTDDESHTAVGTTPGGNRIEILSEFVDCEVKIPTGFIEPHFFAGMSGGGKAIMPGLASLRTVQGNHTAKHMDHPQVRWGVTDGNPLWEDIRDAAMMTRPTFLLNVAMNRKKEITAVFAGDFLEAHQAGCEYVRRSAMVPVNEPFDIVVTSNSGYPLDLNMYQSVKGMSAAAQIVRTGGHIIMAADCWDGIPEHGDYGDLLGRYDTPDELLNLIRAPGFVAADMWQAQIHALICQRTKVHFYSENLSDEQIRRGFMKPCRDIAQSVIDLASRVGPGCRICVLPEGPQTIPYLREPVEQ